MLLREGSLLIILVHPVHIGVNALELAFAPYGVTVFPVIAVGDNIALAGPYLAHFLHVFIIEFEAAGSCVAGHVVQIVHEVPGVHLIGDLQRLVPAKAVVIANRGLALGAALGRDEDHTEGSARTVD